MRLKTEMNKVYYILIPKKRMAAAVLDSFGSDGPPPIRPESVESAVTRLSHQGNKEYNRIEYNRIN
jgi:hypothetical protein